MKLNHLGILSQFANRPALIDSQRFNAHMLAAQHRAHQIHEMPDDEAESIGESVRDWFPARAFEVYGVAEGVATVPIKGAICRGVSKIEALCYDLCDIDRVQGWLRAAMEDANVHTVILDINSPGGACPQVPETAAMIAALREKKNVIARVDELCASAGYWLASAAGRIEASPTADIGSIGVYLMLFDVTEYYRDWGVKVEVFKSGKYKAMGAPGTTLNDEQRAYLQEDVDLFAAQFKAAVRAGRAPVEIADETMEGQTFLAREAMARGLVDEVLSES